MNIQVARSRLRRAAQAVVIALAAGAAVFAGLVITEAVAEADAAAWLMAAVVTALTVGTLVPATIALRALWRTPRLIIDNDHLVLHDPTLFTREERLARQDISAVIAFGPQTPRTRRATFAMTPFNEPVNVEVRLAKPRRFAAARRANWVWAYSRRGSLPHLLRLPDAQLAYQAFRFRAADQQHTVGQLNEWLSGSA